MIFKTIEDGNTTKIVTALKARKIAQEELNISITKQTAILETDKNALLNYENAVKSGVPYEKALANKMSNASTAAKEHALATKGAAGTTDIFVAKQKAAQTQLKATAIATNAVTKASKALATVLNIGVYLLISKGIELTVNAINNYVHRVEKANEAMNNAVSDYETTKSELESINSELETNKQKINEIKAQGKLSYVEENELERLQAITEQLQLEYDIAKRKAELEQTESTEKAIEAYNTQYGDNTVPITQKGVNDSLSLIDSTGGHVINAGEDDISANIANFQRFAQYANDTKKQLAAESKKLTKEEYDDLKEKIKIYEETVQKSETNLTNSLQSLSNKKSAMQDAYNSITQKQKNGEDLSEYEKSVLETYNIITENIELIYKYLDPDKFKEIKFSDIFNTDGIEKTKEELIEMAEAGELTPETLQGYPKLNKALKKNGISAKDCCEQLYELADAEDQAQEIASKSSNAFNKQEMISAINEMSSGFEELDKIFASISDKDPFDFKLLDDQAFKDTFGGLNEDYTNFIETITSSPNDINACKNAFNELIGAWIESTGILEKVDDSTATLTSSMLEMMGVENAEELVTSALKKKHEDLAAQKYYEANATDELKNSTIDEYIQFYNDAEASDVSREALARLELAKIAVNNVKIDTSSDIDQVIALANAAGSSANVLSKLAEAKAIYAKAESGGLSGSAGDLKLLEKADEISSQIKNGTFDYEFEIDSSKYKTPIYGGGNKSNKSSGSKSSEKDKWLEAYKKKLSILQDELDKELIDERKFYDDSEALMNEYLKDSPEHIKNYEEEIASAEKSLHGDWANAYQAEHDAIEDLYNDGKISVKEYYSQLKRLANGYGFTGEAVGKYGKYTKEAAEAQKELNEIAKDALDNAIKGATYLIDKQIAKYNKLKDAADESYNAQIKALDKQIKGLDDQIDSIDDLIDDLEDQADAIDDQIELIEDQTDAIDDQIKAIENEIDNYDRLIDEKQKIIDQMQDENNERDRQIALQKAQSELDKALNNNTTSTFSGGQWTYTNNEDEVSTARENVRDAQNDINVAAIQKEIDLLNEGKDALQAQIDLFEKQKEELQDQIELFEKQKEAIQDQIDAYEKQKEAIQEQIDLIEKQKDSIQELMDKSDEYFEKMIESIEETKSRWEELSELDTNAKMMQDMEDVFNELGYTAQDVLNMSDKTFAEFKDKYLDYMMSVKGETDSVRQALSTMANVSDIQWLDDYLAKTGVGLDSIASIDLTGAVDSIGGVNDGLQDVKDSSTDTTETIVGGMSEVTDASYNTATSISADMGVVKESTYDASKAINGGKDSKAEGESLTTALTATKATASTTVPAVSQMFDNVTSSVKDSTKAVDDLRAAIERLNSTKVTAPGVSVNSKTFSVKQRAKGDKRVENDEWSWTQEKGAEIIASPTRNAVFTPLNAGDTVFTNEMSENLWEWGKLNPNFLMDHMEFGKGVNATKTTINNNNSSIVMNVSLNLPNVTNDSGVEYIQKELTKLSNNLKVGKYQYFNKI